MHGRVLPLGRAPDVGRVGLPGGGMVLLHPDKRRLFVVNHTGNPDDDCAFVNPELFDMSGDEEGEEGCLSLPNINAMIQRGRTVRVVAKDVQGNAVERTATGYLARIWQHEFDHLNGILITDRMGDVARMAHRKTLRELEAEYEAKHPRKRK